MLKEDCDAEILPSKYKSMKSIQCYDPHFTEVEMRHRQI